MDQQQKVYSRTRKDDEHRDKIVCTGNVKMIEELSPEERFVYDTLVDDFADSRREWQLPEPQFRFDIPLPSVVSPLKKFSKNAAVLFFPGKMPVANDVAQWVRAELQGDVVEGVYWAARGFYEVLFKEPKFRIALLEKSPLMFGTQLVHILPWSANKDYESIIKHKCPVWVTVKHFPKHFREHLPLLAASLGKVICPPRPTEDGNRFMILWDTTKPVIPSVSIGITCDDKKQLSIGRRNYELVWGTFAGACFKCKQFGHISSRCPTVIHKPPAVAVMPPQSPASSSTSSQVPPVISKPSSSKAPSPSATPANASKGTAQKNVSDVKQKGKMDQDGFVTPKKTVKVPLFKSRNWTRHQANIPTNVDSLTANALNANANPQANVVSRNWVQICAGGTQIFDKNDSIWHVLSEQEGSQQMEVN